MKKANYILKSVGMLWIFLGLSNAITGSDASDTIVINSVGHGSLYFEYKNLIIHVDPYSAQADYNLLPDANLIFITHGHSDHYDLNALNKIKNDSTVLIYTQALKNLNTYTGTTYVLNNGDSMIFNGIPVKAVPAYNVVNTSYHPKGVGNGYVFTFGEKRIYVAGDTENIPEMNNLGKIDIAFLPMNLPFTMTPTEAANAAKAIKPDILYIYHFGSSDTASLRNLLSDQTMIIRMGKSVYYESDKRSTSTNTINLNTEPEIRFYPNPVYDYLTVYNLTPGSSLSLFDLSGRIVFEKQLQNEGEQKIDFKSIISGMYIISYKDNQIVRSSMIVKK